MKRFAIALVWVGLSCAVSMAQAPSKGGDVSWSFDQRISSLEKRVAELEAKLSQKTSGATQQSGSEVVCGPGKTCLVPQTSPSSVGCPSGVCPTSQSIGYGYNSNGYFGNGMPMGNSTYYGGGQSSSGGCDDGSCQTGGFRGRRHREFHREKHRSRN